MEPLAAVTGINHLAVRFLDNMIDMNRYPVSSIQNITTRNRKIGVGVMGFAHLLILLDIPYDSPGAAKIGEETNEVHPDRCHSRPAKAGEGVSIQWLCMKVPEEGHWH